MGRRDFTPGGGTGRGESGGMDLASGLRWRTCYQLEQNGLASNVCQTRKGSFQNSNRLFCRTRFAPKDGPRASPHRWVRRRVYV
jgi:hypothetical protein